MYFIIKGVKDLDNGLTANLKLSHEKSSQCVCIPEKEPHVTKTLKIAIERPAPEALQAR